MTEMTQADPNNEAMKQALKEALTETLHEKRELLQEVFAEVLEDFAFAESIREGRQTERVDRDEVFNKEDRLELLRAARGMWKDREVFTERIGDGEVMAGLMNRITVDPEQCEGRPCIRGMRIRVSDVLDLLADGLSTEEIIEEMPDLELADIYASLRFASRRLD